MGKPLNNAPGTLPHRWCENVYIHITITVTQFTRKMGKQIFLTFNFEIFSRRRHQGGFLIFDF